MKNVSILITVYNAEKTIRKVLENIINQTYEDLEIVIVNDGANDGSSKIIQELANGDNRIKFIDRKENRGRCYSLDEALRHCTSEYIFINDSDDISELDRVEKTMDFYEGILDKEKCGLIGGSARTKNTQTNEVYTKINKSSFFKHSKDGKVKTGKVCITNPFVHSSVMYKRKALEFIGGFDNGVTSSIDYFAIIKIANSYDLYTLQDVLVTRQVTGDNFFMQKNITEKNKGNMRIIDRWIRENIKFGDFYRNLSNLINMLSDIKRRKR